MKKVSAGFVSLTGQFHYTMHIAGKLATQSDATMLKNPKGRRL
jgi:hypothetical protein